MKLVTTLCRLFVGALFIFSGLVKQNDPLGFSYKLEEYFEVFHATFLNPYALTISIVICALEIIMGAALLLGYKPKQNVWGLLGLIVFFTFLTFWSAFFNVVRSCGCFGDAIPLTAWESFYKDLVLLVLILVLFFNMDKIKPLFDSKKMLVGMIAVVLFGFGLGIYTYRNLPFVDFLPYKVGNHIPDQMVMPEGAEPDVYEIIYTLKNKTTAELKKLDDKAYISTKIYEDTNWEFVEATEPVLIKSGYKIPIQDLKIGDEDGKDVTEILLQDPEYSFWVVEYDLKKADLNMQATLSQLALMTETYHGRTIGLTSTAPIDTENFRQENGVYYEFFYADAIPLKSMVRSNPGIMLMKNGTVINKWHYRNLPSVEELEAQYFN